MSTEEQCLLCVQPLDASNHDVVFVTCSASGCDRQTPYHADCARAVQLSKKSNYTKALDHYHKRVSPATYELRHLLLADSPVPVQCMHAIEPHSSCPVSAFTGCTGVITASTLLRKMLPSATPSAPVKSPKTPTQPTTPTPRQNRVKPDTILLKTPKLKLLPAAMKPFKPAPAPVTTPQPSEPVPAPTLSSSPRVVLDFHPLFYTGPNFTSVFLNALKTEM